MKPIELPETYDFISVQEKWKQQWDIDKIYQYKGDQTRENTFVVDSPPPTVSGSLHIGHVFSYTHQDLIVRFQRMFGKDIYYPMGWDDNGLPTERRVQNLYNVRIDPSLQFDAERLERIKANPGKNSEVTFISRAEFIEICGEATKLDEEVFRNLWQHLGLSIDWNEEYATIDKHCRMLSQSSFLRLYHDGHIYMSERPTMWDVDFGTAIAQAEVEDREVAGAFHDIRFSVDGGGELIIATTRPELLAACVAVVAHPDDDRYKHLFGHKAITPLFGARVPIIADSRAEIEKGTGILMVCTFGDATDIEWWSQYQLPLRQVIDKQGRMLESIDFSKEPFESYNPEKASKFYSEIARKNVKQAQKRMVELLSEPGSSGDINDNRPALVRDPKPITHPVKFYEKGERPLEFIPARQWFIRIMDKKELLLSRAKQIAWHPEHMFHRIEHWIEGLNTDWCISRQRYFGVPFPVWYKLDENGEILYNKPIFPNAFTGEEAAELLPIDPMNTCPDGYLESQRGKPNGFTAETDVMDTWMTSSLTPQIGSHDILDLDRHSKLFPCDIRPQAHEIIRTWAFYTIVKASLHDNNIPWYHVIISGWVLDPDRKKMSKSRGNAVTPMHLLEQYSADGLRYWSACARLGTDTAFDEKVFKIGKKLVTKLFNASKFVLNNLQDFDPENFSPENITEELDKSLIEMLRKTILKCTSDFVDYEYTSALEGAENFFWNVFCDNYLELVKMRCYDTTCPNKRLSAQTTLYLTLKSVLKLFAPFQPFITEEVWSWYYRDISNNQSIHSSSWPNISELSKVPVPVDSNSFSQICEILAAVRKFKSQNQCSIKTPVELMQITECNCGSSHWFNLDGMLNDLSSAGNIETIEWVQAPEDNFECTENRSYKVNIKLKEITNESQ